MTIARISFILMSRSHAVSTQIHVGISNVKLTHVPHNVFLRDDQEDGQWLIRSTVCRRILHTYDTSCVDHLGHSHVDTVRLPETDHHQVMIVRAYLA